MLTENIILLLSDSLKLLYIVLNKLATSLSDKDVRWRITWSTRNQIFVWRYCRICIFFYSPNNKQLFPAGCHFLVEQICVTSTSCYNKVTVRCHLCSVFQTTLTVAYSGNIEVNSKSKFWKWMWFWSLSFSPLLLVLDSLRM